MIHCPPFTCEFDTFNELVDSERQTFGLRRLELSTHLWCNFFKFIISLHMLLIKVPLFFIIYHINVCVYLYKRDNGLHIKLSPSRARVCVWGHHSHSQHVIGLVTPTLSFEANARTWRERRGYLISLPKHHCNRLTFCYFKFGTFRCICRFTLVTSMRFDSMRFTVGGLHNLLVLSWRVKKKPYKIPSPILAAM